MIERQGTMKLAYARLVTSDVPKLARFYEEILGVAPAGSEEYVELRIQGGAISICSKRSVDLFNAGAAEPAANRSVVLDFQVEDVDLEQCRLRGVVSEFVLNPADQPWGNRSMLFRDPDGNLINFFAPTADVISYRRVHKAVAM
jgi:catechol 2,3-dioxygenase-like lactoylglutathione lyase family enzyme